MDRAAIENVFNLKGIRWVEPGSIKKVLSSWNGDVNVIKKERWKIVQHVYGGQFGQKETRVVLRMSRRST